MAGELPEHWLSIDPGDVHVAIAQWLGPSCVNVFETDPRGAEEFLEGNLVANDVALVAYERFALDLRRASQQNGSEFLTSQLIGVIKYICRGRNVPTVGYRNSEHKRIYSMDWFKGLTPAEVKAQPWYRKGGHCKDAWCVGMWHKHKLGHGEMT